MSHSLYTLNLLLGIQITIYGFALRKDLLEYGLSMPVINNTRLLVHLPWNLKFVPALLCVDSIGYKGYYRKPHIMLGSAMASIFIGILMLPDIDSTTYLTMVTLYNIFIVLADVAIDGAMIDRSRTNENVIVNCEAFRSLGYIIGDTAGVMIWYYHGSRGVFAACCYFTAIMFAIAVSMHDHRRMTQVVDTANGSNNIPDFHNSSVAARELDSSGRERKSIRYRNYCTVQMKLIISTITHPSIAALIFISFISSMVPSSSIAMFYYMTEELNFQAPVMAMLALVASIARIVTMILYRGFPIGYCIFKGCKRPEFDSIRIPGIRMFSIKAIIISITLMRILVNIMPAVLSYQVDVQVMVNGTMTTDKQSYVTAAGMNPVVFSIGDTVFEEVLDTLQMLPLKQVTGHVCENSVEASAYSVVMSIINAGNAIQILLDSEVMKGLRIDHGSYDGLFPSILISQACHCAVLILSIVFLKSETDKEIAEQRNNEKTTEFLAPEFTTNIPQEELV